MISRQNMPQQIRAQTENFSASEEEVEKDGADIGAVDRSAHNEQRSVVQPDATANLLRGKRINCVSVLLKDGAERFDDVVASGGAV